MKSNSGQNLKLGLLIVAGLIIFTLGVYFIGNKQNLFGDSIMLSSVFKNVNGLQPGNNVRYSGVNVGTVKEIKFLNDTAICVDMLINRKSGNLIKQSSVATINSDGLVGSMVLNILPNSEVSTRAIQEGDTLESLSQVATADMLNTLNQTNENAALLTADLLKITNSINAGEGVLGDLLKNDTLAKNIQESAANLNQTTNSAKAGINKINSILNSIDYENSLASTLLSDSSTQKSFSNIIEDLKITSSQIKAISVDLGEFSNSLNSEKGALNYVVKDTGFVNYLDKSMQNIEEATFKFNENMEALKHNILFRGYFRKLERQKAREEKKKQ
ncbi:phospholipid/cholesterol/gamma-HCH transport system substrate-binding protein [Salegentibacter holothuriorum]|uniref:Phospholipid/cholesterol/gamma-HCH transport system substrate-binding protein n=1 Tax=Salegentibacter holothuriorum TaxID=241145 RepID=A0A1T5AMS9_9FLAO|nr:MlaD family protein [Salegentibacter holothuriorum]SKB36185.1 phospholipid/cholesterol/gamma-HCH transport system substrate-binding protein [Salegentibacter holothuriorum]